MSTQQECKRTLRVIKITLKAGKNKNGKEEEKTVIKIYE